MIFEDPDPETGGPNWGCPRFAFGLWFVDWYDVSGNMTGASLAKSDGLEWIRANPEAVAEMQGQVETWLKGLRA
jgi:hypothetical protein